MKSSARFIIENARVTRTHGTGKVTFVSLAVAGFKAGSVEYHDVTAFASDGLSFEDGQSVTVKGSISRRKPKDGERNWTTELIAREVQPGDENLTVAMPAMPAKRIGAFGNQGCAEAC